MPQRELILPVIRRIEAADSIAELTLMLHRAYGGLAARGMRFLASHQDDEQTRRRIADGECYLAIHQERIIATITWRGAAHTGGSPWLDRPDVASFGQFGVEPVWQKLGIGARLLAIAEQRTMQSGAAELALDTAEPAHDLIQYYTRHGFQFIEHAQWKVTNYRSVIMSKSLRSG